MTSMGSFRIPPQGANRQLVFTPLGPETDSIMMLAWKRREDQLPAVAHYIGRVLLGFLVKSLFTARSEVVRRET